MRDTPRLARRVSRADFAQSVHLLSAIGQRAIRSNELPPYLVYAVSKQARRVPSMFWR